MNGLAYTIDDDSDSTPVFWMGILLGALIIHAIALFGLTFKTVTPVPENESFTISLDDPIFNLPPIAENEPAKPEPAPPKPAAQLAPAPAEVPASIVEVPSPTPQKPKEIPVPPPPAAAPVPPPVAPVKTEVAKPEKKEFHDKDLPNLDPHNETAFDESTKTTKVAPPNGYLSDRNSTAADRGPKTLKKGDPYVDVGDTPLLKTLQKRGEGNVPPINSDPNSGSVKIDGAPDAGDGGAKPAPDLSKDVKTAEVVSPIKPKLDEKPPAAKVEIPEKPAEVITVAPPAAVKPDIRPASKYVPPEPDAPIVENGTSPIPKKIKDPSDSIVQLPTQLELEPNAPKKPVAAGSKKTAASIQPQPDPSAVTSSSIDREVEKQAELEKFAAELNGTNTAAAGDGTPGLTGPKLRKGQRGNEGNGTARPGDDNAYSDVTSINLESSAEEFGDPRYEKRFDPKTAYIKRFARRIDGKWKADIHAHLRVRLVPGTVSIRVILRKDGKLLEASEAYRNRGVPDEYVATAKRAVEEAAKPTADPFPDALMDRETIEYTFNFLYQ